MKETARIKFILKSGIEVEGYTDIDKLKKEPRTIEVITDSPYMKKHYLDKTFIPTGELLGNGAERVNFFSDKSNIEYKKKTTTALLISSTIKETIYL